MLYTKLITRISAVVLCFVLFTSVAMAQTGTVNGTITDSSGAAVEGVEVFLAVNFGTSAFEGRYACTDASGNFSFSGVPTGVPLASATGPAVDATAGCANDTFVAPSGVPYIIQYYNGGSIPSDIDVFTIPSGSTTFTIGYTLTTWQTEGNAQLHALIRGAHRILSRDFGRDFTRFDRQVNRIITTAERLERTGRISSSSAASIVATATNYLQVEG